MNTNLKGLLTLAVILIGALCGLWAIAKYIDTGMIIWPAVLVVAFCLVGLLATEKNA